MHKIQSKPIFSVLTTEITQENLNITYLTVIHIYLCVVVPSTVCSWNFLSIIHAMKSIIGMGHFFQILIDAGYSMEVHYCIIGIGATFKLWLMKAISQCISIIIQERSSQYWSIWNRLSKFCWIKDILFIFILLLMCIIGMGRDILIHNRHPMDVHFW